MSVRYNEDFKKEVVRTYMAGNKSTVQIAADYNIAKSTVSQWVNQYKQPGEAVTAAMFQAMRDALAEQKQNPLSIDDVAAMVAGQIGQLTPMDEETADLFKQLAKKMMKGIE